MHEFRKNEDWGDCPELPHTGPEFSMESRRGRTSTNTSGAIDRAMFEAVKRADEDNTEGVYYLVRSVAMTITQDFVVERYDARKNNEKHSNGIELRAKKKFDSTTSYIAIVSSQKIRWRGRERYEEGLLALWVARNYETDLPQGFEGL